MANNRMFLLHRPSGYAVYLGKRMGWGWYNVPDDVKERIEELFRMVEEQEAEGNQDAFILALETDSLSWRYTDERTEKGVIRLEIPNAAKRNDGKEGGGRRGAAKAEDYTCG